MSSMPQITDAPWARSATGANTFDRASGEVLPTIYERTTAAAMAHGGINLGQGFPDDEGPIWMRTAAAEAITSAGTGPTNQYAPGMGLPVLREAVSARAHRDSGITLNPATEVMITTGATEAIAAALLAFTPPGSEVLAYEPAYDSYGACVALAGASLRTVALRAPDFRPDLEALEALITERTSVIMLNTPHNPTGTVFSRDELTQIVQLAHRHGLTVICDEVYEHLVFDDAAHRHTPILSVDGASEVAVAIGSAGKSFSFTGWKIGWLTGSSTLVNRVRGVKQFLTFSSGPAFQWAVAGGLDDDRGFFASNRAQLAAARDRLTAGLTTAGFEAFPADAGYFVLADCSAFGDESGAALCHRMVRDVGVGAIPVSGLSTPADGPDPALSMVVRFAFCKNTATLDEALRRLGSFAPMPQS